MPVPQRHVEITNPVILKQGRIVDEQTDRPKLALGFRNKTAHILFGCEVSLNDTGVAAARKNGVGQSLSFVNRPIAVDRNRKAMGSEVFDNRLSDAPRAARYKNRTFCKLADFLIVQHGKHFLIEILS
jgi:hypothetical protein